jgi:hypothetical protein
MGVVYVFVEGDDDERFVKSVLSNLLLKKYTEVKTWCYREKKKERITAFLRTIDQMGAPLIFLADIDKHPCITRKKADLVRCYPELKSKTIIVVKAEIESWYVAGVELRKLHDFGIDISDGVDKFTKEDLEGSLDTSIVKTEVLIEFLKEFSIDQAKSRSASFTYLLNKTL